jgi:hypothetical protein
MNLQIEYDIRYSIPGLQQRTESAVMTAIQDIMNEDPGTPDHANRYAWAQWANVNTSIASIYFMWGLAMNPSIQASVAADPSGLSVPDNDIQFVVNSNISLVINECVANPPSGFNPPLPPS